MTVKFSLYFSIEPRMFTINRFLYLVSNQMCMEKCFYFLFVISLKVWVFRILSIRNTLWCTDSLEEFHWDYVKCRKFSVSPDHFLTCLFIEVIRKLVKSARILMNMVVYYENWSFCNWDYIEDYFVFFAKLPLFRATFA